MVDEYQVKTIQHPVSCKVTVPGSKSVTNRALLLAALAEGRTRLDGVMFSDDARYFLQCLQDLGIKVVIDEENKQVWVEGTGGIIPEKRARIYVGSAGTGARFLTAMAGCSDGVYTIDASEQMKKRPMKALFSALQSAGAKIRYLEREGYLPVEITGAGSPSEITLDISESTQFLSAFLLLGPMYHKGLKIKISSEKKDGAYIRITRNMIEEFGGKVEFDGSNYVIPAGSHYHCKEGIYQVEPDVSAACYFYAAAAVSGGSATVLHVHKNLMQGDLKFLEVLESMGCEVEDRPEGIHVQGPKDGHLKAVDINMNNFSDQALTLAAIAPYADGPVTIRSIAHSRKQESDRVHAIAVNLEAAGISCDEREDGVTIYPGQPHACRIRTYEDHRVAMAFALFGLRSEGIIIENPGCCAKTFAEYFDVIGIAYY